MTKRALVLSGGGAKGCWQAGVIHKLHSIGLTYDAYFGVSVGAINAAHMAQFTAGFEMLGSTALQHKWFNFANKDVWRHHNKLLRWLVVPWKRSVYDTSPLRAMLKRSLNLDALRNSGKYVQVGITDLTSGGYLLFDPSVENFHEAVYASAAFPVMFDPGRLRVNPDFESNNDHLLSDGGLVHITPLKAAIEWGATHVDAITVDPPGMKYWRPEPKWYEPQLVTEVIPRTLSVVFDNIIERDLQTCAKVNRQVLAGRGEPHHRHIELRHIRPHDDLPIDSLDFDPEKMREGWLAGFGMDVA